MKTKRVPPASFSWHNGQSLAILVHSTVKALTAQARASEAPRLAGAPAVGMRSIPDGNHGDNLRSVQK